MNRKICRRMMSVLLVVILSFSAVIPASAASAASFSDVAETDWYYSAVDYVCRTGLMNGTSQTKFEPQGTLTRAMFVTILGRLAEADTSSYTADGFQDVEAGQWYTGYIAWASETGIVTGYSGVQFGTDDPVTREQMATMIERFVTYLGYSLPEAEDPVPEFTDMDAVSSWAVSGLELMRRTGLITGYSDGSFGPGKNATRAEAAVIMQRLGQALGKYADTSEEDPAAESGVARPSKNGALQEIGSHVADAAGKYVQLRGISTHGLSWYPEYVNQACFNDLSSWGANVVRLAMYTEEYNGYCVGGSSNQTALKNLIRQGVQYASNADMYVIIDWHILSDGDPTTHQSEAAAFFAEMSKDLAQYNNVLYEICNEPNGGTSWSTIKAYAENIIPIIRANDPDAVVIVGTPNWSQEVDKAAADPITGYDNIMYSLHFYAATHKDSLRNTMASAVKSGLPVFVTEFGICDASGSGSIDTASANAWIDLLNEYGVSYVAWNLSNKDETSAIISSSVSKTSGFTRSDLSESGKWLYDMLTSSAGVTPSEGSQNTDPEDKDTSQGTGSTVLTNSGMEITVRLESQWQSGDGYQYYLYNVSLRNISGSPVTAWEITLDFSDSFHLEQSWNGVFSVSGTTVTIGSLDWNGSLAAGGETGDIGFIIRGDSNLTVLAG